MHTHVLNSIECIVFFKNIMESTFWLYGYKFSVSLRLSSPWVALYILYGHSSRHNNNSSYDNNMTCEPFIYLFFFFFGEGLHVVYDRKTSRVYTTLHCYYSGVRWWWYLLILVLHSDRGEGQRWRDRIHMLLFITWSVNLCGKWKKKKIKIPTKLVSPGESLFV